MQSLSDLKRRPVHREIRPSRRNLVRAFPFILFLTSFLLAQREVPCPPVPGLAHAAFRVSDLSRTTAFYEKLLGYESFSLGDETGKTRFVFVKVNEQQYIELLPGNAVSQGQLDHFALYTDDLVAMRRYLIAHQVPILLDIHKGRLGNPFITVRDPDGHHLEILQYSANSLTAQLQGQFMPNGRVSDHITHVGILVKSLDSALKFYRDVLGFHELRAGGSGQPSWVDLRVPNGSDYIELLAFTATDSPGYLKSQNHVGLASSDLNKTVTYLQKRAESGLLTARITLETGGDQPQHVNLFDPDGARLEIMEPPAANGTSIRNH
jgi:catechol 2,3-dioxygenase-like lactoylglutathione lyase family enzyme